MTNAQRAKKNTILLSDHRSNIALQFHTFYTKKFSINMVKYFVAARLLQYYFITMLRYFVLKNLQKIKKIFLYFQTIRIIWNCNLKAF